MVPVVKTATGRVVVTADRVRIGLNPVHWRVVVVAMIRSVMVVIAVVMAVMMVVVTSTIISTVMAMAMVTMMPVVSVTTAGVRHAG